MSIKNPWHLSQPNGSKNKFNIGDKVVCINSTDYYGLFSLGKIYIIEDPTGITAGQKNMKYGFFFIKGDDNKRWWVSGDKFKDLNKERKEKLKKLNSK